MHRVIPLHLPQRLPKDWELPPEFADSIPSEERLIRKDYMDDDYYENYTRIHFQPTAIVYAAMHALNTAAVPSISSFDRGAFNHIFLLQFPSGFKVAARLTDRSFTSPGHIASTVAMMTMAKHFNEIPVPDIYAWYPGSDNPVGAPYILMEWAEGISPFMKWHSSNREDRAAILDQLANHHTKFAKPLPFEGIGSLYFAENLERDHNLFSDIASYRLGPPSQGPACTDDRKPTLWPQTLPITPSLREFWLALWQHEVDAMTKAFNSDRDAVIASPDTHWVGKVHILGDFLDAAERLLILIRKCPLPDEVSQPGASRLCLSLEDYAFQNILMDPDTNKITAFLDWDDVYVRPFFLCSRYPTDICWWEGRCDPWEKAGCFKFVPHDEEGNIEDIEELEAQERRKRSLEREIDDQVLEDSNSEDTGGEEGEAEEPNLSDHEEEEDQVDADDNTSTSNETPESTREPNPYGRYEDPEEDRRYRIKDTWHRRQYRQSLAKYDPRFAEDKVWETRTDPMKIHYLVTHGWFQWVTEIRTEWLMNKAEYFSK